MRGANLSNFDVAGCGTCDERKGQDCLDRGQSVRSSIVMEHLSALPPKADINWLNAQVRFVPNSEVVIAQAQLYRGSGTDVLIGNDIYHASGAVD
jgi:hypothetical protein